jgi:polysaccharide pyruvyl transferase WcaK-like protein
MDAIVVRGNHSRAALLDMGVPDEKVTVAPDTAFLSERAPASTDSDSVGESTTVGLALNADKVRRYDDWGAVVERLSSLGHRVLFISNDPAADRAAAAECKKRFGIPASCEKRTYREYMSLLGRLHFVISSRLHTNELALAAGTPVIPLEGNVFKTREVFELIQYPLRVINTDELGWVGLVHRAIDQMVTQYADVKAFAARRLPLIRQASRRNLLT